MPVVPTTVVWPAILLLIGINGLAGTVVIDPSRALGWPDRYRHSQTTPETDYGRHYSDVDHPWFNGWRDLILWRRPPRDLYRKCSAVSNRSVDGSRDGMAGKNSG
tara:strand:+ start:4185 stop:4499 length:315 start_codon:yes stop_codon:yes gene_type:complete